MFDFKKLSNRIFNRPFSLKHVAAALLFLSAFALLPVQAVAQKTKIVTTPVSFAKGKSSASVKGTAQVYATYAYTLHAKEGQEMTVGVSSPNDNIYFTVFSPGGLGAFSGEEDLTEWTDRLPKTGTYKIMVFSKSDAGASAYTLKISIK